MRQAIILTPRTISISKSLQVPLSPLKSPQMPTVFESTRHPLRDWVDTASGLLHLLFDSYSVARRLFTNNKANNSRRTAERVPKLSRLSPEAISMRSRRISEQCPNPRQTAVAGSINMSYQMTFSQSKNLRDSKRACTSFLDCSIVKNKQWFN